jgi:hypothetical protein
MDVAEMTPWLGTGLLLIAVAVGLLAHLPAARRIERIPALFDAGRGGACRRPHATAIPVVRTIGLSLQRTA